MIPSFATCWRSATRRWSVREACSTLLISLLISGCQSGGGEISPAQTKLAWLGSMYGMYISQNGGQTPKSMDEFRKFIEKKATAERLQRLGVANMDELLTSSRDGKPFVLVTHTKLPPPGSGQPVIVLYEETGEGGQHAISYLGGITDTVDEDKLSQLLPAKAKAP